MLNAQYLVFLQVMPRENDVGKFSNWRAKSFNLVVRLNGSKRKVLCFKII